MEETKTPIHRAPAGFDDIRDLTLGSWKRMALKARSSSLTAAAGCRAYVIEAPGAGAITAEKHMYEGTLLRARGARHDGDLERRRYYQKQTFEWQPG